MAILKQRLQDALQASESTRGGQNDPVDQREKKKIAALHYKRRKLDKDVRKYINTARRINSRDIERIGVRHGFKTRCSGVDK